MGAVLKTRQNEQTYKKAPRMLLSGQEDYCDVYGYNHGTMAIGGAEHEPTLGPRGPEQVGLQKGLRHKQQRCGGWTP